MWLQIFWARLGSGPYTVTPKGPAFWTTRQRLRHVPGGLKQSDTSFVNQLFVLFHIFLRNGAEDHGNPENACYLGLGRRYVRSL